MFGRRNDSLRDLIRSQHKENMDYLRQREKEMNKEFEQRREESKRRDEEFKERAEESKRLIEESERRTEETREFNREILLRNEKVYTNVIVRLEEMGKEIRSNTEETRAQTQALLRLIDRFDRPGGTAAA